MISEKNKITAILVLAAALRLTGVNFGLPELYHQDEPIMVNHALAIGASGGNPHFFIIGSFGLYALFFLYALYFFAGRLTGAFVDPQDFAAAFLSDPGMFYLLGRLLLGVAFGIVTVWAVYRIGKKRFSQKTGLWAALFLAVLPMHVQQSHYIYADIPLALAVLYLLDALKDLTDEPSYLRYVKAGMLGGWAMSIKYTAVYFFPAALLAHFWASRGSKAPASLARLVAGFSAAVVTFVLLSPYLLLAWTEFYSQVTHQTTAEHPVGWMHHFAYSLVGGSGLVFLGLAMFGFVTSRLRDARLWTVWGGAVLAYYAVNAHFGQPFARYMMPLVPLFALWAGFGIERLWSGGRLPRVLVWALAAVCVLEMGAVSAYSDYLFTRTDTRVLCREWVQQNIPAGSVIAVDNRFFAPRLKPTEAQIREKYRWLGQDARDQVRRMRLDLELAASGQGSYAVFVLKPPAIAAQEPKFLFEGPYVAADEASLERIGARYLILSTSTGEPAVERLETALEKRLESVAVFSPYRTPGRVRSSDAYASTAAPHQPGELFARQRLGPALKVYRIRT